MMKSDDSNFLLRYGLVKIKLERLAGLTFNSTEIRNLNPLQLSLREVFDHHVKHEVILRDWKLAKLGLLVKELETIRNFDRKLLKKLCRNLRTTQLVDYLGARCEIEVAYTLINSKMPFSKTEAPDFSLGEDRNSAYLECHCIHLDAPKKVDLSYKIQRAINGKGKQEYCNYRTALCLDVTNIDYNSQLGAHPITLSKLTAYTKEQLAATKFGSCILISYRINRIAERYECNYKRVDNIHLDDSLRQILNKVYPFGNHTTNLFAVTSWG